MELFPSLPDALSTKGILKSARNLALPILLAMGCVREDTEPVAQWIDHDAETFDIKIQSSGDEVTSIPYSLLALMQDGDEIDTDGHKNFELPIRTDPDVSEDEQFDLDAKAFSVLYVNAETWCGQALDWLSIYKLFIVEQDGCISDLSTCGEETCDEDRLWTVYQEAINPVEDSDTGEEMEEI